MVYRTPNLFPTGFYVAGRWNVKDLKMLEKYEMTEKFEEGLTAIEKELELDIRFDINYSRTTESIYYVLGVYSIDDEDLEDELAHISVRISNHEKSHIELSKDVMLDYEDVENNDFIEEIREYIKKSL